jgi:hypothetical protein
MKLTSLRPIAALVAGLLLLQPFSARAADVLRLYGDAWRYNDTGIDQGTAWRDASFDDSAWAFNFTELGFGDGDEATVIQSNPNGLPLNTAYFRSSINIANPTIYSNLSVWLLRDDGAVVYLNGVEVYRNNLPAGAVTYGTKAVRNIEGDEESSFAIHVFPASALVAGPNVLAVEMHQAIGGDADMTFAMFLFGHQIGENQPPSAFDSFQAVDRDVSTNVTLNATDPDNDSLTYTLLSSPQHGTLTGTAPNLIYTPNSGYTGPDTFSFMADDGEWMTGVANVSLEVRDNRPPVADAQSLTVAEDNALNITLTASDADGDALAYSPTAPAHGVLSGSGGSLIYQPAPNYFGPDSFTFTVDDGNGGTDTATISINVTPINDAPFAVSQSLATDEDAALPILLTGSDVEADALTFAYNQPAHGVLTGTGALLSYQPALDYNGPDSFTFSVADGNGGTAIGTISIAVAAVNDQPAADAQAVMVAEDGSLAIALSGSDVDADVLAFSFTQPSHGTLVGDADGNTLYTPSANYHGSDSFTFTVNDGNGGTASAVVSITVSSVNDSPTGDGQSVSVNEDNSIGILVTAADIDGDALSYTYTQPAHGSVNATGSTAIYQPAANYNGPDSFTFTVDDGNGGTATATVTINVVSVNDVPVALASAAPASDPTNLTQNLVLVAKNSLDALVTFNGVGSSDADGGSLTYAWYEGASTTPFSTLANPTVSLSVGNYVITLVVSDGTVTASDTITVVIFTPCDALKQLVADVQAANLKPSEKNGLLGHLNAACSTFANGNNSAAVHQLELFKERVTAKVAPVDPSLAAALNASAQQIIDEVTGQ